jgi:hypothetical protein
VRKNSSPPKVVSGGTSKGMLASIRATPEIGTPDASATRE